MSSVIEKISSYIPTVEEPVIKPSVKEKIRNMFIVIFLYGILAAIPIYGLSSTVSQYYLDIGWIFGSSIGSLATLGVSPIVVASLILQLLVGSKIIDINVQTDEGKRKYNNYYRFLIIVFIFIESLLIIVSRSFVPSDHSLAGYIIIFLQIVIGGFIIYLLDDFSSKYSLTSGLNLIIFSSISFGLLARLFNILPPPGQFSTTPSGFFPLGLYELAQGNTIMGLSLIGSGIFTIFLLLLIAYIYNVDIEIPVLQINVGGRVHKFPIKVIYNVLPVLIIYAFFLQFQMMFSYDTTSILYKIFTPPYLLINIGTHGVGYIFDFGVVLSIIVHLVVYALFGMLLAYFWMIALGMDAKALAEQLASLPIGNIRYRDPRILEEQIAKYLYPAIYLSGAIVGGIVAISDIIGSALPGISLIILVLIAASIYNDLKREAALAEIPIIGKYIK